MQFFYDTKTKVLMLNDLFHSNAITTDLLSRSLIIEIGINLHAKSKSIMIALLNNTHIQSWDIDRRVHAAAFKKRKNNWIT